MPVANDRDRSAASPLPWLALVAVYTFWGSTYLAIRVAVESIPPFLMAGTRFLVAGALLYPLARRRGRNPAPIWPQWRAAAGVAVLLLVGGNGLVSWAEQTVPSGIAALLVATVPLWMVVLDRLRGDDPLTWQIVAGVLIGFGGLIILIRPTGDRDLDLVGTGVILFASLMWAAGSIRSRTAALPDHPLVSTAAQMITGGATLIVIGAMVGESARTDLAAITPASGAAFGWLVLLGSIVGFSSYVYALRTLPTATVATYAYVNPVVAVFLGWLILDEPLDGPTVLGGAVIAVAVALIVSSRPRRARPPAGAGIEPPVASDAGAVSDRAPAPGTARRRP